MSDTNSSVPCFIGASFMFASCQFWTMPHLQTPPFFRAWLVHPSWPHSFTCAPCLLQTPPWTATLLLHPSCLHLLTFAPCLIQTPPFFAWLVHPSRLHLFTIAPCLFCTPLLLLIRWCILRGCITFSSVHKHTCLPYFVHVMIWGTKTYLPPLLILIFFYA